MSRHTTTVRIALPIALLAFLAPHGKIASSQVATSQATSQPTTRQHTSRPATTTTAPTTARSRGVIFGNTRIDILQVGIGSISGDPAVFLFTRTGPTDHDATITYDVSGNAVEGGDFARLNRRIVIPRGFRTATVFLPILNPNAGPGDQRITLKLRSLGRPVTQPTSRPTASPTTRPADDAPALF